MNQPKYIIKICSKGHACKSMLSVKDTLEKIEELIEGKDIILEESGCMAMCGMGPNIKIMNTETNEENIYNEMTPDKITDVIKELS